MTKSLTWIGDDIACSDRPAHIDLRNSAGQCLSATVPQVLEMINDITDYGRERIISALRYTAQTGQLHPQDTDAFLRWEVAQPCADAAPPAWRLVDSNGTDYGTFPTKQKAERFAAAVMEADRDLPILSTTIVTEYTAWRAVVLRRRSNSADASDSVVIRGTIQPRQSDAWDEACALLRDLGEDGLGCRLERMAVK